MACNKENEGTPPQDDPKDPNFICTNCHNNVYELCDECMERIDVQEILAKIQKNKGKDSTKTPKTTPTTTANDTQIISENETPNNDPPDSPSLLERGVLEGHNMDAENDTSEAEGDPPSAVLVSITKTDANNYKYEFKYEPRLMTPTTTAANTQTTPESDTECEEIHEEDEENNMDSDNSDSDTPILNFDNSNSDDPITPGGFLQSQEEEDPENTIYDSDGNEVVPGHQL